MRIPACFGKQHRRSLFLGGLVLAASTPLPCGIGFSPCRAEEPAEGGWRYVVSQAGQPMAHPPLRALRLSETKPADLKETVTYRGSRQRYAELRLGTPTSQAVAIVVDTISPTDFDLYVDARRDRSIRREDHIDDAGPGFRVPVDVNIVNGLAIQRIPRTLIFRVGRGGRSLSYAVAGYLEGTIDLDGRSSPVRRMDGDGNGGMGDDADLLWIDLDGDGHWDSFTERFATTPVLKLGNARYALNTDWVGDRLSLKKLEGSGTISLSLAGRERPLEIVSLEASLVGYDGSVARLSGLGAPVTVPVGQYRLYQLSVVAKDSTGGPPWALFFAEADPDAQRWHRVEPDSATVIDPLSRVTLSAELSESKNAYEPGEVVQVRTRLTTADGLLLTGCCRSDKWAASCESGATVRLESAEGATVALEKVGFT
ncbi:MAG: hypothetical protein HY000_34640 [Planctomycetes bacterium]|nr:hypothetical protein [Planctomycetota bacterium]